MKPVVVSLSSAILLAASALLAGPARADDRELQAILLKSGCVPSKIVATSLLSSVVAYDVTCKGSRKLFQVVCRQSECRLQSEAREDDER
jgi:uncharacterized membrane-anchored protein